MMAKHFPTPTPAELQELFDLPDNGISQCDLSEIFEAQVRIVKLRITLQEARDQFAGLMAHLEIGLRLGLPIELGYLGVSTDPRGRVSVIRHEQEDPLGIDGLWF